MQPFSLLTQQAAGNGSTHALHHHGRWLRLLAFAAVYLALWAAGWYASGFVEDRVGVSLWFLPAGLRFVCLFVLGRRGLLLELIAQLAGALYMTARIEAEHAPTATDALWVLYAWLAPLAAYCVVILPLRRGMHTKLDLARPVHIALFLAAALAASTLSALAGCLRLFQLGLVSSDHRLAVVADWLIGDLTGILTLAPLLLLRVWPRLRHYLRSGRFNRRQRTRQITVAVDRYIVLTVLLALWLVFALPWQQNVALHSPFLALLLLLPLVWVALRYGLRGTVLAVALLDGGLVVLMTLFEQRGEILNYQFVMVAIALVGLWLGTLVDRYVRAEASRNESETSFRATFEQAAVGMAMISNRGICLRANATLCAILGYPLDELVGRDFHDIVHPDDLARVRQTASDSIRTSKTSTTEQRFLRRDGRVVWVRVTLALVEGNAGKPNYVAAVIEDIEDRKQAENALLLSERALKEAQRLAGVGNWTWDVQDARLSWSQEINRICGRLADAPAPDAGELQRLLTPTSWARLSLAIDTALISGVAFARECEIVRADATRRWVMVRGEAVRSDDGEIVALRGTLQDISEQKQAAEALRELNAGLEQRVAQRTAQLLKALHESTQTRQRLQFEIDQHHETEQRLHEAQMNLNHATRIAALGAWSSELRDLDVAANNTMTWSGEMYRLLGYSPDELPTPNVQHMLARVHPSDLALFTPAAMRVQLGKRNWQREFRIVVDGREHLLFESAEVVFDADGKPIQLRGASRDITAQREAETRLRNSEARLQMALKGAGAGSFEWDFVTGNDRCSDELGALYGLPDGVAPASYAAWRQAVHADDRERVGALVDQAIVQGVEFEVEWRVNLPPVVNPRWMISRACPVRDEGGTVSGYLGLSIDITEQKLNEIHLQQYRDDLKGMVAEQTAQLVVANAEQQRLNRALRLLSDCNVTLAHARDEAQLLVDLCRLVVDSGGYLLGSVWFVQDDPQLSMRLVARYVSGTRPALAWDNVQPLGDGPTGTAIRSGAIQVFADCQNNPQLAPWKDAMIALGCHSVVALPLCVDQRVIGAFALYSAQPTPGDHQEMKVLEELANNLSYGLQSLRARNALVEHQRLLEQRVAERTQEIASLNADLAAKANDAESANRAKSVFLSTMSHEIRTPLNAIVGLTGLLADSPLNRRQRDYASKIRSAAQNLNALIDDVLDFSKIEAGALRLENAPFSLDAILNTVAVVISAGTAGKPVEALFDVAPGVPDGLIGDAMRVQQILVNLAGNAAKFTAQGEIVVGVRVSSQDEGHVTIEFRVSDTGIGIAEEHQSRIFAAFDQGDASTSRRYGGTGLGLAISARLASLMGSHIALHSRVGQGSEFRFAVRFEIAAQTTAAAHAGSLPHLRVLIVDDHALARSMLAQTCAALGWSAQAVDSAAAALAELRRSAAAGSDYDVVLLDWRMPQTDGIEMLKQAHAASDVALPLIILMVSTFELEQAVVASEGVYIDSLLAKPTTPASLFDAVNRAHSGELVSRGLTHAHGDWPLAGMRLLVAEDNDLNQLYVEQILTRAGAEVVVVDNGVAAVDALRASDAHFDAVVMDIEMPQMGGYAATRLIREELGRNELPIIAVTAYAQTEDFERSRQAGMNGHLVKPIDENDLLAMLAEGRAPTTHADLHAGAARVETPASPLCESGFPGVDLNAALKAFGGDEAKYTELLHRFVAGHRDDIAKARALFNDGDATAAASLIHGICGMASVVHALEMAHLARATEEAIGNWSAVPALFDELQNAMRDLSEAIDQQQTVQPG
jgi:PAS domain S-box-containing protein